MSYPTQKPVELFEAMIAASVHDSDSREQFVVCDPFVGSGSSAVAALRQGCSFMGCDIAQASITSTTHRVDAVRRGEPDPLQPDAAIVSDTKVFWQSRP